jgi:ribosome maturation factor RimP
MLDDPQAEQIRRIAEAVVAEQRAELVECNVHRHSGGLQVRLLVDRIGGVTVQDCTRLNRLIGQALDEQNAIESPYTLEVSSPGLDRPLVSKRDFERAIGEDVDFELSQPVEGVKGRALQGRVLAVQEEAVVIVAREGSVTVPFPAVQRARKTIRL